MSSQRQHTSLDIDLLQAVLTYRVRPAALFSRSFRSTRGLLNLVVVFVQQRHFFVVRGSGATVGSRIEVSILRKTSSTRGQLLVSVKMYGLKVDRYGYHSAVRDHRWYVALRSKLPSAPAYHRPRTIPRSSLHLVLPVRRQWLYIGYLQHAV